MGEHQPQPGSPLHLIADANNREKATSRDNAAPGHKFRSQMPTLNMHPKKGGQ
jgi:hypothetical protein